MTSYSFYRGIYMGGDIPEGEFSRLIRRAEEKLSHYRRIYTIEDAAGSCAEQMAICAMCEALYNVELVANGSAGIQSASIGSVSTSYGSAGAKAVDVTPAGVERALFEAARIYLDICTGVDV